MSRVTVTHLVRAASRLTKTPEAMITGDVRERPIVRLRWAVMVAARQQGYSTPHIGNVLGGKDHSTVLYGLEQSGYLAERHPEHGQLIVDITKSAKRAATRERARIRAQFAAFAEVPAA